MTKYTNDLDNHIDVELCNYIRQEPRKSFFLFAGAGSGKTRSLVNLLQFIKDKYEYKYQVLRKKVAVITYTNAASEEIERRLGYSSIFTVSTIHSFIWSIIKYYQRDIKEFINNDLSAKLTVEKGKRSSESTKLKIIKIEERIASLSHINKFRYNPNGDNAEYDSLSHAEIISIGASFIKTKILFQKILIQQYPIMFIDESQDTNKHLLDAVFELQSIYKKHFTLGLFGDIKQQIYFDVKANLGANIPDDWEKPAKQLNHRSAKRIITLINKIAEGTADNHIQLPRIEAHDGYVRLFIVNRSSDINKVDKEQEVISAMRSITNDNNWKYTSMDKDNPTVKTLILEHRMAALRLGFYDLFNNIYSDPKLKSSLIDGTLAELKLFTDIIIPIYNANIKSDKFTIASIIKKRSPLLDKRTVKLSKDQPQLLKEARDAVNSLCSLWKDDLDPSIFAIIENIKSSSILNFPSSLLDVLNPNGDSVWFKIKDVTLSQLISYSKYISGNTEFGTHQGVKGLEFDRVMVVIDDTEAGGTMFQYNKLFGLEEKSKTDIKNEQEGKETVIDRTTRLFYVTCSRAKESLAIVAYTSDANTLRENLIAQGWFTNDEIKII